MYYLGIGLKDGLVYAGGKTGLLHRLHPYPMLLPLRFESFDGMADYPDLGDYSGRLFLEDSFDPITRVRRGRVYCGGNAGTVFISPLNGYEGDRVSMGVYQYQRESLHKLRELYGSKLPLIFLGSEDFSSTWKIVDIEQDASDTFVLVLKSYRSLGEIPEIQWEVIPEGLTKRLGERIEHVENAVNRSAPNDVVDRCRDALSLILSNLAEVPEKDLGGAIKAYSEQPEGKGRLMVHNAAQLVRRLHSRGKPNEEHKLGTRPLEEDDAQLAVRCLGLVLKEVGWAS